MVIIPSAISQANRGEYYIISSICGIKTKNQKSNKEKQTKLIDTEKSFQTRGLWMGEIERRSKCKEY